MADKRFLERHGEQWRVSVAVPRDLLAVCGKTRLKIALGTDSLSEANRQKGPVVEAIKGELARLRSELVRGLTPRLDLRRAERVRDRQASAIGADLSAALVFREQLATLPRDSDQREAVETELAERSEAIAGDVIGEDPQGHPVYDPRREAAARQFFRVATGQETPLRQYEQPFRSQKTLVAATWGKFDKIMRDLEAYLGERHLPASVETVSRRVAGDFINVIAEGKGWKANTSNNNVSALRSYWKFMVERGGAESNPWSGQSLAKDRKAKADRERPFTTEEMRKLLSGKPTQPYLADLIRVAALTGARLEVLVSLRVGDCKDGVFVIAPQKMEPGSRLVPIHSALAGLVARRTEGREDGAWLFPEVPELDPEGSPTNRRSNRAGKAFTVYRKRVGVDDSREGERRSKANFHSLRRWFITAAHEALAQGATGFRETTISEVVGHKLAGMTAGVYKGAAGLEERRACVEAVKLPS